MGVANSLSNAWERGSGIVRTQVQEIDSCQVTQGYEGAKAEEKESGTPTGSEISFYIQHWRSEAQFTPASFACMTSCREFPE